MKKMVKKSTEKYVTEKTFEKHMANISKSFSTQHEVLQGILKELHALHEDNKYTRNTLSSFVGDVSSHDRRIDDLTSRIEKLELKSR